MKTKLDLKVIFFYQKPNKKFNDNNHFEIKKLSFWLTFFSWALAVIWIVFFTFGYIYTDHSGEPTYSSNPANQNNNHKTTFNLTIDFMLPENISLFRSLGLVAIVWYFLLNICLFLQTYSHLKILNKKQIIFNFLSWIPLVAFGNLYQFKWREVVLFLKNFFQNDPKAKAINYYHHWTYWTSLVTLIVIAPVIFFIFAATDFKLEPKYSLTFDVNKMNKFWHIKPPTFFNFKSVNQTNLWTDSLTFFTNQTNLLCWITIFAYVVNPHWKIFHKNNIFVCVMSYISVVGGVFDFIMVPVFLSQLSQSGGIWANIAETETNKKILVFLIVSNIYFHLIVPIVFVLNGCFVVQQRQNWKITHYNAFLRSGFIIPVAYMIYLIFLPFVSGYSVYGILSNIDPKLSLLLPSVKSDETNVIFDKQPGSPFCLFLFLAALLLFFISLSSYWLYDIHCLAKHNKIKLNFQNRDLINSWKE